MEFAGLPASAHVPAGIRDRVFGLGAACLSHISALDAADSTYAAGLASAWPVLARWAEDAASEWRPLALAAGVPLAQVTGHEHSAATVTAYLRATAEASAASFAASRAFAAARVSFGIGHGARSSLSAGAHRPNLLVSALSAARDGQAGRIASSAAGFRFVIARILGVPVWSPLGIPRPLHCPRCLVAAGAVDAEVAGPRGIIGGWMISASTSLLAVVRPLAPVLSLGTRPSPATSQTSPMPAVVAVASTTAQCSRSGRGSDPPTSSSVIRVSLPASRSMSLSALASSPFRMRVKPRSVTSTLHSSPLTRTSDSTPSAST